MFVYCKKCGLITKEKEYQKICPVCETDFEYVPSAYLSPSGNTFASKDLRVEFEELIKNTEEYDVKLSLERNNIIKQKELEKQTELNEKIKCYNQTTYKLKCPICHSENVTKISNLGKVVKVGALGILGAGDIGKKYKCNSCGYKY